MGDCNNHSTPVAMTKLDFIKLISNLSVGDHAATIEIDGKSVTLKGISNLHLGSIYSIFESSNGELVRLEITEEQDFDGPVSAKILNTEFDEYD